MQEEAIINKIEANNAKLNNIEEKQEIIGDSLQNKYNHLSKTMGKIHQNVKSNNQRYHKLLENIREIRSLVEQGQHERVENQIHLLLEEYDKQESRKNDTDEDTQNMKQNRNPDYKTFMTKWFNKNLKITKNPHNVVDMEEITNKLDKNIESEDVQINREKVYEGLESYLEYWYNTHNTIISFQDIISDSINNTRLYSYLKFININEERENRIKNSILAWLREHTCEVEGSKTYTEDILRNIQPIFENNGWIITNPTEYNQLQQAGFTKVCVKRTFSQIIGKAVQELYSHITKDTIQRDTPGNGNVTWYPNLRIIDKQVSDNVQITIKDELSNDVFESDNIVCKWLNENIEYTGNMEDTISRKYLLEHLRKHLKIEDALISENTLQRLFNALLERLHEHYGASYDSDDALLRGFRMYVQQSIEDVLLGWMEDHLLFTGVCEDRVCMDILDEKLLTELFRKNINIIHDDMYQQLPKTIRDNFIQESQYKHALNNSLLVKVSEYNEENRYIEKYKIMEYKSLKREDITQWIEENIEQHLKSNVSNKKQIIENFKKHMQKTNTKNNTNKKIEKLIDEEIQAYYTKQNTTLKLLNDSQDEYYVLIN